MIVQSLRAVRLWVGNRCWLLGFGPRAFVDRVAADTSRFPPLDPAREAGRGPDAKRLHTPVRQWGSDTTLPSVEWPPTRQAAVSSGSRLASRETERNALHAEWLIASSHRAAPARCGPLVDVHCGSADCRRACASLVASFAAGVRELALERMPGLHTTVPIATFGWDAPARGGAFIDVRRVVVGDEGAKSATGLIRKQK